MINLLFVLVLVCFTGSVICVIFGFFWFFLNYLPSLDKNEEAVWDAGLSDWDEEDWDNQYWGIDCYEDYAREYKSHGYY